MTAQDDEPVSAQESLTHGLERMIEAAVTPAKIKRPLAGPVSPGDAAIQQSRDLRKKGFFGLGRYCAVKPGSEWRRE